MNGQIHKTAHLASEDADDFFGIVMNAINEFQMSGLIVETQYQSVSQLNGKVQFSVLVHGRK